MTRVEAPSRLHFGLISLPVEGQTHWPDPEGKPGLPVRSFGGVGLMIDKPGVVVEIEPAKDWMANGVHAERALAFAKMFVESLPASERRCFRVHVASCPPEHIGLGVGTSLGLSVSKAIAIELGHDDLDSVELAKRIGRGRRSSIGIHGFEHGGLIVEAGKLPGEATAPLVGRFAFPVEWPVLLLQSQQPAQWHGSQEQEAFMRLSTNNDSATMCRIVLTGLLPAVASRNYPVFADALYEFNHRAGTAFHGTQGGVYASRETAIAIAAIRQMGFCAGQTSWGPTIFAVLPDRDTADALRRQAGENPALQSFHIVDCSAARNGPTIKASN